MSVFVLWQNNLLPNGEQSVEGNSFTIQKADRHQAGVYICSASNGVGTPASSAIEVKVQCKGFFSLLLQQFNLLAIHKHSNLNWRSKIFDSLTFQHIYASKFY